MLEWVTSGNFLAKYAPHGLQRFNDICLSGNGESTLSEDFLAVCQIIARLRIKFSINSAVKTLLITNGSELHKPLIQAGIKLIAANQGEIWFKIDRATHAGIAQVNQVNLNLSSVIEHLRLSASLCPTFIQSCWFKVAGVNPPQGEVSEFIQLVLKVKPLIAGVFIYSTARNPALPEGQTISSVSLEFLESLADSLRKAGIVVKSYL